MTTAADVAKKRQLQEQFYKYNSARGLAAVNSRCRKYKKAVDYYTQAAEAAEKLDERFILPLTVARSIANCKCEDLVAAREDIELAKQTAPEDISVIENDAFTLLEQNDFEHALVQYTMGHERHIKSDTFDTGIKVCRATIKTCIGEAAGPIMDKNNLGQTVVDMVTKKNCNDTLLNAEQRQALYKKTRIKKEKFLGEKYFPGMEKHKEFLQDCATKFRGDEKVHGKELLKAVNEALQVINQKQVSLMAQHPMYVWKYNEPKVSRERLNKVEEEKMRFKKGVESVINRLVTEMNIAYEEESDLKCFKVAFQIERYINSHQIRSFLNKKEITKMLEALYSIVGDLYLRMKKLQIDMNTDKNDRRIYCMLGIEMPDTPFVRKIKASLMPHVLDRR